MSEAEALMWVRYTGGTWAPHSAWGENVNPQGTLDPGAVYEVVQVIPTPLLPQYRLAGYEAMLFKSACFSPVAAEGEGG